MLVAYCSDLHREMNKGPDILPLVELKPDVLILAGDIHEGAENFVQIMEEYQHSLGCHIIGVTGNHEGYDGVPIQQTDATIYNLIEGNPKLHFLQNSTTIINGVLFLGGTFWTDMCVEGHEYKPYHQIQLRKSMNDFKFINLIRKNGKIKKLTTDYWNGFHNATRHFIYETLKTNSLVQDLPTVVVTHHPGHPSMNGTADYKQQNRTGYVSDCEDIYRADFNPDYWISGHVHESLEHKEPWEGTQFLVNCYGYEPTEPKMVARFKWKYFEIGE